MRKRDLLRAGIVCCWLAHGLLAGTLGRVVSIGGHGSDLALDEARGVLYVANYTANQIEVISTPDLTRLSSIPVAAQPGSMALSPDGQYLLVTHYSNFLPPATALNGMTLIRLRTGARQTFALPSPPLGAGFTSDNRALVATSTEFLLYEPSTGGLTLLATLQDLVARTLPVPPANLPPQIVAASLAVSGDGERIYGLTDTFRFRFDRHPQRLTVLGYVSDPPQGPRVVSVSRDGSYYAAGWGLFDWRGTLMAQFPSPLGLLHVGSHAIDSDRGLIYAQIPREAGEAPALMVADADNLAVRERFNLPENLAGKSVLSANGAYMYSISASGIMALPVGAWERQRRLTLSAGQLFFQANFCDRRAAAQEVFVVDAAGGQLDFRVTGATPGVSVSTASGVTPAGLQVRVDPSAFADRSGTVEAWLEVTSAQAVNAPQRLRVLINLRAPDQRGTVVSVAGRLVDILADPSRNRFYILRQDTNEVLVYDGADYHLIASLRTGNTPTQMAFTFDRRYLLVGNDNSQIANVYDLETLWARDPIRFPAGHYPRSLAASGRAILAATRVAGPKNTIDRVDFATRSAAQLPALGVWENDIHLNTVLTAAANGSAIMAAQADGNLLLYDATADTFTVSRKDAASLAGAYSASSYNWFVVDNLLLNSSLVPWVTLDKSGGATSGFAVHNQTGFLTTAVSASSPGVIQRYDLAMGSAYAPTRMAEASLLGTEDAAFTRTLAVLADRRALVSLTTSGFTVLAWDYDASTIPPRISQVVNAADFRVPVAPGGLMAVFGSQLSPMNAATSEMPLPRALGESCLLANGAPVPMLFVSPGQINAQMPYEATGNVSLVLHTPGGVSDTYRMQVAPTAPSVFLSGTAGPLTGIPTLVRAANGQLVTAANPVHRGDALVVYLTGMGQTWPAVESGAPAPLNPLAQVIDPPAVTLGGHTLPVTYAGLTPGLVGVNQINVQVPDHVPTGLSVPLAITQGGSSTSLPVRVVE
ncbi:MAG: hypothetical protein IT159_05780 [Bryobacterales bacterium]|nr:hypothetical protein [Bryobacterales bacterium]